MELCVFQPNIADNLGAMIRTASCFAVEKIHIILPTGFVFREKELKGKALDHLSKIQLIRHTNFDDFMSYITDQRLVLLTTKSKKSYYNFQFKENDIIMVGNETYGVPENYMKKIIEQVKIPMPGSDRSLNVATSYAIAVSEANRQFNSNIN